MQLRALRLQGFYSYVEPQELDFAPLLEAGLFGIIGNTGAGKSALLEALLLALFGEAPRMYRSPLSVVSKWKDPRAPARVELAFVLKGQTYCAWCDPLANGPKRGMWRISSGLRSDCAEPAEDLLGIGYEEFTTAILLPQGQIDRFLTMKATERHALLLRLFNLDIIDRMSSEASKILSQKELELKEIQGRVGAYEEQIKSQLGDRSKQLLESEMERLAQEREQVERKIDELRKLLEAWGLKKSFYERWKAAEEFHDQNKAKYEEYEEMRARLSKLEALREKLLPLYHQWMDRRAEQERIQEDLKKEREKRAHWENERKRLEPLYKEWEQLSQALSSLQGEKQQLEKIDRLTSLQQQIGVLQKQFQQKEEETLQLERELREMRLRITSATEDLQKLNHEIHLLQQLENWYKMLEAHNRDVNERRRDYRETSKKLLEAERFIRQSYTDLFREFPKEEKEKWMAWLSRVQGRVSDLQRALLEQQRAAALAQGLKSGQPCPVCGSVSHPKPACFTNEEKRKLERYEYLLRRLDEPHLKRQLSEADDLARDLQNIEREGKARVQLYEQFRATLPPQARERGYAPEPSEGQKVGQALNQTKEMLAKREREKDRLTREAEQQESTLGARRREMETLRGTLARLQGEAEFLQKEVQNSPWLTREGSERQARLKYISECLAQYEELKEAQVSLSYHKADKELGVAEQNCQRLEQRLSQVQDTLQSLYHQIEALSQQSGFHAEEAIEKAVRGHGEIQRIKAEVEDFMNAWKENEDRRKEYAAAAASYEARAHQACEATHRQLEAEREQLSQRLAELRERLSRVTLLEEQLEAERTKLKELTPYVEALTELKSLLSSEKRSKSFRSYVLKSYVERLISQANQYLQSWTSGFLELRVPSLEESKGLEIEVVDRLARLGQNSSDKVSREVRTLSGGQTFMVSLALALALSDEMRARSNLDKSTPLFIDEGFGTLDSETLDQVVATLRQLARSGRPICIITHRMELKEKLDAYVEVVLDEERRTSVLRPHWQQWKQGLPALQLSTG
ncbi:MAG: SMC family ATPase [Bacteroidia bacterium]